MDQGTAADGGAAGGGSIPAIRSEAAYLVTGAGALALAAAVTARVALSPGSAEGVFSLGAGAGVALLAVSITSGYSSLAHWGVGVIGAFYVASVVLAGPPDAWSIAVAIALLLAGELATWSIDSRRRGRDDLAVHGIRLRSIVLVTVVALVLALLTQDAALFGPGGDIAAGLAVLAVLAAIAAICALMWRSETRSGY